MNLSKTPGFEHIFLNFTTGVIKMVSEDKHVDEKLKRTQHLLCPPLDDGQAANFLGVAVQTLRNWRHQRRGPAYVKLSEGPRGPVRYLLEDLKAFQSSRRIDPEAA